MDEWGAATGTTEEPNDKTTTMIQASSQTADAGGGWWGWISKTSESVVNIAKSELTDFKNQITEDTKQAASEAAKKEGVQKVAAGLSSILGLSEQQKPAAAPKQQRSTQEIIVSRREASIRQLQEDERTYLTDVKPSDAERFGEWQQSFDLSTRTDDISVVLSSNPKVRAIHSAAVPEKVSYAVFWKRYFFRLELLLENEQKRAALLARTVEKKDEAEPSWDDDEALDKELAERSKTVQITQSETADNAPSSPAPASAPATPSTPASPAPSVASKIAKAKAAAVVDDEDRFDWENDDDVSSAPPPATPTQPAAARSSAPSSTAPPPALSPPPASPDSFVTACSSPAPQSSTSTPQQSAVPVVATPSPAPAPPSASAAAAPAPAPAAPPPASAKATTDWDAWE